MLILLVSFNVHARVSIIIFHSHYRAGRPDQSDSSVGSFRVQNTDQI